MHFKTKAAFVICYQWHSSLGSVAYRGVVWVECSNYTFSCVHRSLPFFLFIYGKSKASTISSCYRKIGCDLLSVLIEIDLGHVSVYSMPINSNKLRPHWTWATLMAITNTCPVSWHCSFHTVTSKLECFIECCIDNQSVHDISYCCYNENKMVFCKNVWWIVFRGIWTHTLRLIHFLGNCLIISEYREQFYRTCSGKIFSILFLMEMYQQTLSSYSQAKGNEISLHIGLLLFVPEMKQGAVIKYFVSDQKQRETDKSVSLLAGHFFFILCNRLC